VSKKSKSRLRGTNRGAVVSPELLAEMTHFPAIAAATPSASLTIEDVRQRYAPPRTLGCKEEVRLALDSALADTGVYSLLQHTLQMGMGVFPQFMGYGALQNIAQNGLVRACILESLLKKMPELRGRLRVVEPVKDAPISCAVSTPLYPGWTVAATTSLKPASAEAIARALLTQPPSGAGM